MFTIHDILDISRFRAGGTTDFDQSPAGLARVGILKHKFPGTTPILLGDTARWLANAALIGASAEFRAGKDLVPAFDGHPSDSNYEAIERYIIARYIVYMHETIEVLIDEVRKEIEEKVNEERY